MSTKTYYIRANSMKDAIEKYKKLYKNNVKDAGVESDATEEAIKNSVKVVNSDMAGMFNIKIMSIQDNIIHAVVTFDSFDNLETGLESLANASLDEFAGEQEIGTVGDIRSNQIAGKWSNGMFSGNIDLIVK